MFTINTEEKIAVKKTDCSDPNYLVKRNNNKN